MKMPERGVLSWFWIGLVLVLGVFCFSTLAISVLDALWSVRLAALGNMRQFWPSETIIGDVDAEPRVVSIGPVGDDELRPVSLGNVDGKGYARVREDVARSSALKQERSMRESKEQERGVAGGLADARKDDGVDDTTADRDDGLDGTHADHDAREAESVQGLQRADLARRERILEATRMRRMLTELGRDDGIMGHDEGSLGEYQGMSGEGRREEQEDVQGDCCDLEGSEHPGCYDSDCADDVCVEEDDSCCSEKWEPHCARRARRLCEICGEDAIVP